jgi:hypothetical protein
MKNKNMKQQDTQREYKSLVIAALVIIAVILLFIRQCGNSPSTPEKTIEVDTVYVHEKADTIYVPKPYAVYLPGKAPKAFEKWDTLYIEGFTEVDTAAILKDYYSFYVYNDEVKHKYGRTFINDTVSQNKIIGRQVTHDLIVPVVTRTITLHQPKRSAVFIGANILGNEIDPLKGYNVNLSFKTKRDRFIEAGYNQLFGGEHYYSLGIKWKLSFRKQ